MDTALPDLSAPFVLYGNIRSGNVYKAALMLSLCGIDFRYQFVDLAAGDQRAEEFRKLNPVGQVPVLTHGKLVVRQSNAILSYLASQTGKFGGNDPVTQIRIQEWMHWEQDMFFPGIGRTRFFTKVLPGDPGVIAFFRSVGERALGVLEEALSRSAFLCGSEPTIADISIYAYARYAEEADFDVSIYPKMLAWRDSVEGLAGWKTPQELLPSP